MPPLLAHFKTKDSHTALLFLAVLAVTSLMLLFGLLPSGTPYRKLALPPATVTTKTISAPHAELARPTGKVLPREPISLLKQTEALIGSAETAMNQALDKDHFFIQLYGGAQQLANRRVVEDVAEPRYSVSKLEDGSVTFANDDLDWNAEKNTHNMVRFQQKLAQKDIPLLYIQAPQKIEGDGSDVLPYGVYDNGNQCADELMASLSAQSIPTLDLRETLEESGKPWSDWFFRTDHHWTPEAALYCTLPLYDAIEGYFKVTENPNGTKTRTHFHVDDLCRNPENYKKTVYKNSFLGSQGKRTGTLYGGIDDLSLIEPTFMTRFQYSSAFGGIQRTGTFREALLFENELEGDDLYSGSPYTLYSGGDFPLATFQNLYNPDGPRVMLFRDSYACTLAPFLALGCSELYTIDMRYFTDDLMEYVSWLKPDLVFVMYTPSSTRLDEMFNFFDKNAAAQTAWKQLPDDLPPDRRENS